MLKKQINLNPTEEEKKEEMSLRPLDFSNYIGQEKIKENLQIYIEAAKKRKGTLDHTLFYGAPGLGKTTLANIIANELGVNIKITSGPAIEKPGDIASILNGLEDNDVLFIDEIHRLNHQVEEVLYPAMEDYAIDILVGQEGGKKSIRLSLPKFTLIGATTRVGLLTEPLRDRFGIISKLEFYNTEELSQIVKRSASLLNIEIDDDGANAIALRSRGTPRLANRLLKRVRDFAEVKYDGRITKKVSDTAMDILDVDKLGLDQNDRQYLTTIIEKFAGGPVGVDTLATALNEDISTIEDVYEPYLIMNGLIQRTKRGRVATAQSYEHLGIAYQNSLLS